MSAPKEVAKNETKSSENKPKNKGLLARFRRSLSSSNSHHKEMKKSKPITHKSKSHEPNTSKPKTKSKTKSNWAKYFKRTPRHNQKSKTSPNENAPTINAPENDQMKMSDGNPVCANPFMFDDSELYLENDENQSAVTKESSVDVINSAREYKPSFIERLYAPDVMTLDMNMNTADTEETSMDFIGMASEEEMKSEESSNFARLRFGGYNNENGSMDRFAGLVVTTPREWAKCHKLSFNGLLIVEIYNDYFGPCDVMNAHIRSVVTANDETAIPVIFVRVNMSALRQKSENCSQLADKGIKEKTLRTLMHGLYEYSDCCSPVPTYLFFRNGKVESRLRGVKPQEFERITQRFTHCHTIGKGMPSQSQAITDERHTVLTVSSDGKY